MQLTIPDTIAAILPFLATALSSWLSDDKLKPGINALIALCAILASAVACELLAGNFTGNWAISFLGTLGYVVLILEGDMSVLYGYLLRKPSPVAPSDTTTFSTTQQSVTTKAFQPPKPITLPQKPTTSN